MTYISIGPRVRSVKPLSEYKLFLRFDNNEEKIYDCSELLDKGVFIEL